MTCRLNRESRGVVTALATRRVSVTKSLVTAPCRTIPIFDQGKMWTPFNIIDRFLEESECG